MLTWCRAAHSHACMLKHATHTHYIVVLRKDGHRNYFAHVAFQCNNLELATLESTLLFTATNKMTQ